MEFQKENELPKTSHKKLVDKPTTRKSRAGNSKYRQPDSVYEDRQTRMDIQGHIDVANLEREFRKRGIIDW